MSLKICTYADPYKIDNEAYWDEIQNCAHFCVSQTMVNGLEKMYPSFKDSGCLTTVRTLIKFLYSDWEEENLRVKQIMEVDSALNSLTLSGENEDLRRSLEYNTGSIAKCIRLFKELEMIPDNFNVSDLNADQRCLVEIYKYICAREKSSFDFSRVSDYDAVDEKIVKALKDAHKERNYDGINKDTVVFHGIHQFTPAMLCAIEDISRFKNVILMFNYQKQYETIYQTWLNIYEFFNVRIVFSGEPEFRPNSLKVNSYPYNVLADTMGKLSNGEPCGSESGEKLNVLNKIEVIEFENTMEFAGYCARLFDQAEKAKNRNGGRFSPLSYMTEQLYAASGKVNDILKCYFPEQYGERHFLDYPLGHFFASITEMWDNKNKRVRVEDMSLIKDCLASGMIKENNPGELLNTFNIIEPYIEKTTSIDAILSSLNTLRGYVSPVEKERQRIGYLNTTEEKVKELEAALDELNKIINAFFSDFDDGESNFDRVYKRIRDFILSRTQDDPEALDKVMKDVIKRLLERMDKIDLPETGTFTCLKQTMSFYLRQDDKLTDGAKWIVRNFEQIDGDILRSGAVNTDEHTPCYHFCCLSDNDICDAKDEDLPWPLDAAFFKYAYGPLDRNYQIFLRSKMEHKNFKRYALLYGLEFARAKCKLSYVKTVDRKENELFHLIKLLGIKVKNQTNDPGSNYYRSSCYPADPCDAVSYSSPDEQTDKIKYDLCPYRFALEGVVQGRTIFRERWHIIFYMRVLLQNKILAECSSKTYLSEDKLRELVSEKYDELEDGSHISDEYEKAQIISGVYGYLEGIRRKHGSLMSQSVNKLKEEFLAAMDDEKLAERSESASGINLTRILNDDKDRRLNKYWICGKKNPNCMYCSCKDVCLN